MEESKEEIGAGIEETQVEEVPGIGPDIADSPEQLAKQLSRKSKNRSNRSDIDASNRKTETVTPTLAQTVQQPQMQGVDETSGKPVQPEEIEEEGHEDEIGFGDTEVMEFEEDEEEGNDFEQLDDEPKELS